MAEIPEIPASADPQDTSEPLAGADPTATSAPLADAAPAMASEPPSAPQPLSVDPQPAAAVPDVAPEVPAEAAEAPPASSTPTTPAAPIASAAQASEPVGIASSLSVPAVAGPEDGEGGEWDLLVGKVQAYLEEADLPARWEKLGGPLRGLGLLLAALILLRLYGALLGTLGDLPLLPRLLQLVGLITLLRFSLTRLVRSRDREAILRIWRDNWNDFRGRA